jgi:hypothetical protein
MTGLNHALAGATVAAAINKPIVALPAALLSHFALDMVPHWDYRVSGGLKGRQKVMVIDLLLSLSLLIILALTVDARAWMVLAGGLLGILPDTMWLRFFVTGKPSPSKSHKNPIHPFRRFHLWIQWSETAKGIYVETVWFLIMLYLIYRI